MNNSKLRIFAIVVMVCFFLLSSSLVLATTTYYLGTSANGYQIPRDGGLRLEPIPGREGWFSITIDFNEENRDPLYDGHWYKVTSGTWNPDGCWGIESYAFQPAPVKKLADGTPVGLGSIYIEEDCELTIIFDSNTKTIYDDYLHKFPDPKIYGNFNEAMERGSNWSMKDDEALVLKDQNGDGIYSGFFEIPAFEGDDHGYMMAVVLSTQFNTQYFFFAAVEQYKFDGTPAGMGQVSYLRPDEDTIYEFRFDSNTKVTEVIECKPGQVVELPTPVIYGDFNGWNIEGPKAVLLEHKGDGLYTATLTLPAYDGEGQGYMMLVCLSKKFYSDQWGMRWGAEEQYKFDGSHAGMGQVSYLKPPVETTYRFTFDIVSKETVFEVVD
ncbi:MAG TPA: hypothetical protein DCE14_04775 [Kosmotogaceae bacterium]|nr:hypothetical protein [Kosmotogaceae bacterium]